MIKNWTSFCYIYLPKCWVDSSSNSKPTIVLLERIVDWYFSSLWLFSIISIRASRTKLNERIISLFWSNYPNAGTVKKTPWTIRFTWGPQPNFLVYFMNIKIFLNIVFYIWQWPFDKSTKLNIAKSLQKNTSEKKILCSWSTYLRKVVPQVMETSMPKYTNRIRY